MILQVINQAAVASSVKQEAQGQTLQVTPLVVTSGVAQGSHVGVTQGSQVMTLAQPAGTSVRHDSQGQTLHLATPVVMSSAVTQGSKVMTLAQPTVTLGAGGQLQVAIIMLFLLVTLIDILEITIVLN